MDEPSMGLAPVLVDGIFETIQRLNAEGTTILLVEQNSNRALEFVESVCVIASGAAVYNGSAAGVLNDAASHQQDSFSDGFLLDHPHYSRPEVLPDGRAVPAVLLSGHHGQIARWRRERALEPAVLRRTERPRPRVVVAPAPLARAPERVEHDEEGVAPVP